MVKFSCIIVMLLCLNCNSLVTCGKCYFVFVVYFTVNSCELCSRVLGQSLCIIPQRFETSRNESNFLLLEMVQLFDYEKFQTKQGNKRNLISQKSQFEKSQYELAYCLESM